MKVMLLVLTMCGRAMAVKGPVGAGHREVEVYVADHAGVAPRLLFRAIAEASEMFADIGVHIHWRDGKPPKDAGCRLVIPLAIADAPRDLDPGIRGFTHLSTGSIVVFYDHIQPLLRMWPSIVPIFLAQVFAHEIGHSLEGVDRHTETGTMKAHWTLHDYHEMQAGRLRFSPEDAVLIRDSVDRPCAALNRAAAD